MQPRPTQDRVSGLPPLARRVLRSTLSLTTAEWMARLLNFAFVVGAVRLLGEIDFGKYATAGAFVGVFGVFFELGLRTYVQRAVGSYEGDPRLLLGNLVVLRLLLALGGCIAIHLLSRLAHYDADLVLAISLQALTFVLAAFLAPIETLLAANERLDFDSGIRLVIQFVYTGLALTLLASHVGFLALFYLAFVTMPLQFLLGYASLRHLGLVPGRLRVEASSWPSLLRASLPFALTSLALVSNFNADTLLLGFLATQSDVGWYNAPYRLVFSVTSLLAGFYRGITPSLVREELWDPEGVRRWIRGGLGGLLFLAIPAAIGLCVLARAVVNLLYGASYAPSVAVLAVLAWDIPLVVFNAFASNATIVLRLERKAARIHVSAAIANILLNLALIPRLGPVGAAIATVTTDLGMAVALCVPLAHVVDIKALMDRVSRILLASVAMGAVVWMAASWSILVSVLGGSACYAVFAWSVGAIDRATIKDLIVRVRTRFGYR